MKESYKTKKLYQWTPRDVAAAIRDGYFFLPLMTLAARVRLEDGARLRKLTGQRDPLAYTRDEILDAQHDARAAAHDNAVDRGE